MQFVDLRRQYKHYKSRIDQAIQRVLDRTQFIGGPEVEALEVALGGYVGREAIGVGSGTEALQISLMALGVGPGDEVITSPFSWISPAESIALVGAKPVFVDIDPDTFTLDPGRVAAAITPKTKAIIPVSLFGQMADYSAIREFAGDIPVIEDAAQSFGAEWNGVKSCGATELAITSFHPAKPLGCYGDGGCVFVRDREMADKIRAIRNHGSRDPYQHELVGMTGRLDTLQAAVLLAKWPEFEQELAERKKLAGRYDAALAGSCSTPVIGEGNTHTYAQYTIRSPKRDAIAKALTGGEIPFGIYYRKPLYKQPVFAHLGCQEADFPASEAASHEVLSLPLHPWLTDQEQDTIITIVRRACED